MPDQQQNHGVNLDELAQEFSSELAPTPAPTSTTPEQRQAFINEESGIDLDALADVFVPEASFEQEPVVLPEEEQGFFGSALDKATGFFEGAANQVGVVLDPEREEDLVSIEQQNEDSFGNLASQGFGQATTMVGAAASGAALGALTGPGAVVASPVLGALAAGGVAFQNFRRRNFETKRAVESSERALGSSEQEIASKVEEALDKDFTASVVENFGDVILTVGTLGVGKVAKATGKAALKASGKTALSLGARTERGLSAAAKIKRGLNTRKAKVAGLALQEGTFEAFGQASQRAAIRSTSTGEDFPSLRNEFLTDEQGRQAFALGATVGGSVSGVGAAVGARRERRLAREAGEDLASPQPSEEIKLGAGIAREADSVADPENPKEEFTVDKEQVPPDIVAEVFESYPDIDVAVDASGNAFVRSNLNKNNAESTNSENPTESTENQEASGDTVSDAETQTEPRDSQPREEDSREAEGVKRKTSKSPEEEIIGKEKESAKTVPNQEEQEPGQEPGQEQRPEQESQQEASEPKENKNREERESESQDTKQKEEVDIDKELPRQARKLQRNNKTLDDFLSSENVREADKNDLLRDFVGPRAKKRDIDNFTEAVRFIRDQGGVEAVANQVSSEGRSSFKSLPRENQLFVATILIDSLNQKIDAATVDGREGAAEGLRSLLTPVLANALDNSATARALRAVGFARVAAGIDPQVAVSSAINASNRNLGKINPKKEALIAERRSALDSAREVLRREENLFDIELSEEQRLSDEITDLENRQQVQEENEAQLESEAKRTQELLDTLKTQAQEEQVQTDFIKQQEQSIRDAKELDESTQKLEAALEANNLEEAQAELQKQKTLLEKLDKDNCG